MTKQETIRALMAVYRVGNASDGDGPAREDWTTPEAASYICSPIDKIFHAMLKAGVLSAEEHQAIYDAL